jgi:hypothetical protein
MIPLKKPVQIGKFIQDPKTHNIQYAGDHTIEYIDVIYHDYPTSKQYFCNIQNIPGIVMLFQDEDYTKHDEITRSVAKNRLLELMGEDQEQWLNGRLPKIKRKTLDDDPNGPGTILSNMLKKIGIKSGPNCSCMKHALEMNEKGADWCEQNLETIIGWLKEESSKRKLPFVETVAKLLVKRAINKSKKCLNKMISQ